jgi:hypothetical protein
MSSESRKFRWWHWLLIALALVAILTYLGSYTLEPRESQSAGFRTPARE